MAIVEYTNRIGFKTMRLVPDGTEPKGYSRGIIVGPPDLQPMSLEHAQKLALNNALVESDFIIYEQLSGRRLELLILIERTLELQRPEAKLIRGELITLYQKARYPSSFKEE